MQLSSQLPISSRSSAAYEADILGRGAHLLLEGDDQPLQVAAYLLLAGKSA